MLLDISRSSWYYEVLGESRANLKLMRLIDEQFLETPYYGARQMARYLRRQGYWVNRKRVRRLMQNMGLWRSIRSPIRASRTRSTRFIRICSEEWRYENPNHVWCADVTYIPMRKGFLYLVAIMDWYSRKVLSWRLSNTLDADFCCEALKEALWPSTASLLFSTRIRAASSRALSSHRLCKDADVKISMDSKGRWMDNVMIERLWRSLKYDCIYLQCI